MLKVWKLGLISFDTALKIQQVLARRHLNALKNGLNINHDTLVLVEHKPVYTVGIRDETSKDEVNRLRSLGAEFRKTNRGGLITFHGPGQLVVYPVINLKNYKPSVKWYVKCLEEIVIQLCDELAKTYIVVDNGTTIVYDYICRSKDNMPQVWYSAVPAILKLEPNSVSTLLLCNRNRNRSGVKAGRSPHTGVWVGDNKIAAIGVHASRYITTHGISLNCDNDLSWFSHIDPCGIRDKGVTSITKETGSKYSTEIIIPMLLKNFSNVFNCSFQEMNQSAQEEILNNLYNNLMLENVGH